MLENALEQMYIIEGKPSTWDWSAYTPDSSIHSLNNGELSGNYFAEKLSKYLGKTGINPTVALISFKSFGHSISKYDDKVLK